MTEFIFVYLLLLQITKIGPKLNLIIPNFIMTLLYQTLAETTKSINMNYKKVKTMQQRR